MDKIREDKLKYYRRVENIIRDIEDTEAKTNEAIRQLEFNPTSIGPANDLLHFLYILEQQYQSDSDEVRTKAREDLLGYMDQFQQSDNAVDEEDNSPQSNEVLQPAPKLPSNLQSATSISQSLTIVPAPPQPPIAAPVSPQPPIAVSAPPPPTSSGQTPTPLLISTTEPDYIRPETLLRYQDLLSKALQYENRYKTVDAARKKLLSAPLIDIMNKLRKETFQKLVTDLLDFLNGQDPKVTGCTVRISNDAERLLCLSMIASLIFKQLLGGDLTDVKTKIFVPLVGILSGHAQHREFGIIFLERLHKKCPYTVPYYPKREPTMTDEQYAEAMGYGMKKEGARTRLETEAEFVNRMSGLIRFFCKLLVGDDPLFANQPTYDWEWMAAMMNLPPRPHITAIILRIFLEEARESMMKKYSIQFVKIIELLRGGYLPRLQKVTSDDQMARLRLTLDAIPRE